MQTAEIIKEIERLPLSKRILIAEKTIHSMRKNKDNKAMSDAAEKLYFEYKNDNELTAFTNIDFEDFYEAK